MSSISLKPRQNAQQLLPIRLAPAGKSLVTFHSLTEKKFIQTWQKKYISWGSPGAGRDDRRPGRVHPVKCPSSASRAILAKGALFRRNSPQNRSACGGLISSKTGFLVTALSKSPRGVLQKDLHKKILFVDPRASEGGLNVEPSGPVLQPQNDLMK